MKNQMYNVLLLYYMCIRDLNVQHVVVGVIKKTKHETTNAP